jgi:predicted metal-dependent HD superfamily phosphohydrolase
MWYTPKVSTTSYLVARWNTTLKRAEAQGANESLIEEILEAYSSKGRYYHVRDHLQHMFQVYDRLFLEPTALIELTFWYHDFFYDPKERDNEAKSADLARTRIEQDLQLPSEIGAKARDLILFSQYTRPPITRDEMILQDIDLAIFGENTELFNRYESDIRLEYSFIPEPDYKKGRASVLRRFLRDPFYFTPEMCYSSYEDLAQRNLKRSIETLEHHVTKI